MTKPDQCYIIKEMSNKEENLLGVLIDSGIASRRRLATAIMKGLVTVNGEVVSDLRHPVNSGQDTIFVDGKPVGRKQKKFVYIMLNKPEGVLSTVRDERRRKTASHFIPHKYRHLRLYPAGRLDMDTTGLLLMTNDGDLTYRLTHPSFENEKEYLVKVRGELKTEELKRLERGIKLDDGLTAPARIRKLKDSPLFNYSVTIHEGRKRQVRRMFAALGYHVPTLKRVRIGQLTLGDLKEGETRELTGKEVSLLSRD